MAMLASITASTTRLQCDRRQEAPMTDPFTEITPECQRRWDAALLAVRNWHESQAKKTLIQARPRRFPKSLKREAEVHQRSAEMDRHPGPGRRLTAGPSAAVRDIWRSSAKVRIRNSRRLFTPRQAVAFPNRLRS